MKPLPYIDKSGDELSIHCLTQPMVDLIVDGLVLVFANIPKQGYADARQNLTILKKAIDNGPKIPIPQNRDSGLPTLPRPKNNAAPYRRAAASKMGNRKQTMRPMWRRRLG